jgi:Acetyltransferase (GNAT) family
VARGQRSMTRSSCVIAFAAAVSWREANGGLGSYPDRRMEIPDFHRKVVGTGCSFTMTTDTTTVLVNDRRVTIRPIRSSDSAAVTIADEWRHTELGRLLMDHLLVSAKQYGIRHLYAIELADNQAMRKLAKDTGMAGRRDPNDANQVIYSLGLSP